ncbi:hypothetical protein KHA80_05800 [Anaerobacillus sp. HL2]|nr:hypothetical protein KHA80_05800 [Anaerobacillus sp. HL2]
MKKKIAILGLGLLLGVATVSTVFANDETAAVPSEANTDLLGYSLALNHFNQRKKCEIAEKTKEFLLMN